MSFLAGRLASQEGSYFFQESKQAVARLIEHQKNSATNVIKPMAENAEISSADFLPEVLRHSVPAKIFTYPSENSGSSLSRASKWAIKPDPKRSDGPVVSPDALNPLRGYVSLPQVTFGPKRWQLPNSDGGVIASTANDLWQDKHATGEVEGCRCRAVSKRL